MDGDRALTFQLTADDLLRLHKIATRRQRRQLRLRPVAFFLSMLAGACIGFAASLLLRIAQSDPAVTLAIRIAIAAVAVGCLLFILAPHVERRYSLRRLFSRSRAVMTPCTLELKPDAIASQLGGVQPTIPWRALVAREEDDVNLYLFIDAANALVVPRAAIAPWRGELDAATAFLQDPACR